MVGKLNLDNPDEVSNIKVSEDNSYIAFTSKIDDSGKIGGAFTVSKRVDVDQGLNRIQTMYLECTTVTKLKLEVGGYVFLFLLRSDYWICLCMHITCWVVNILGGILHCGILVKRYYPSSDVPIDLSQIITQL